VTTTNRPNPAVTDPLLFFNDFEARTVEAIAERIIPGDETDIGATDAGVVTYIDRTVAGFGAGLQKVYRLGLRDMDVFCRREHGAAFVDLSSEVQDDVVRRFLGPECGEGAVAHKPLGEDDYDFASGIERHRAPGADTAIITRLFAVVREHAIEGLFCDPAYGGNRDAVGWRLVGFPGVHWGYTEVQMKEGFDGRTLPVKTLSDLRSEIGSLPPNETFSQSSRE
jgi:gluconate 2-dehydrogenase gamma chain